MESTVEQLVTTFCDALQIGDRLDPFVKQAEAEGRPQLAKMFRAAILSENVRIERFRTGIPHHAEGTEDLFVCPYCGLIYDQEAPEKCLVDETPGKQFRKVE